MSFKNVLKNSMDARKIFGRKEMEIIIKQLDGLPLTQSEKNRLSRDIKPKLDFIKEISSFKDEFKLEKNQENKKIIQKAADIILKDELSNRIKAILLFGSFANNSFTKRSDIDICVVFKKELSLKEATQFRIRVSGQLSSKADVQVFNILPQKIKREIARNHKILYQARDYDNISFTIKHLKENDYFMRMKRIFAAT